MKFLINIYYRIFTRQIIDVPSYLLPIELDHILNLKGCHIIINNQKYYVIKTLYYCFRAQRLLVCKYKE